MRSALSSWPLLLAAAALATIGGPVAASSPEPPLAGIRGARRSLRSSADDDPRVLAEAPAGSGNLPTVQVYVKASGNSPWLERSARLMRECTSTAPEGRVTFMFDNNNAENVDRLGLEFPNVEINHVDGTDNQGGYKTGDGQSTAEATKAQRIKTRMVFMDYRFNKLRKNPADFACYLDDDMAFNYQNLQADLASKMKECHPNCIVGEIFGNAEGHPWHYWTVGGWCMSHKLVREIGELLAKNSDETLNWKGSDDGGFNAALRYKAEAGELTLSYASSDRWFSELSIATLEDDKITKRTFFSERMEKGTNIGEFAQLRDKWSKEIDPGFLREVIERAAVYYVELVDIALRDVPALQMQGEPQLASDGLADVSTSDGEAIFPNRAELSLTPIRFQENEENPVVLQTFFRPTLHDKNIIEFESDYRSRYEKWVLEMHGSGEPTLATFHEKEGSDSYYAIWTKQGPSNLASAWQVDGSTSQGDFLHGYSYENPDEHDWLSAPLVEVDAPCFGAFTGWQPQSYGHVLDYHLSQVAFLAGRLSRECRLLLLEGPLQDILLAVDEELYNRVLWLSPGTVAKMKGSLAVAFHPSSLNDRTAVVPKWGANAYLQSWLNAIDYFVSDEEKVVVYHSRVVPQAKHGRIMDPEHNGHIIEIIRRSLERNGRPERLVVYDGTTLADDGSTSSMPILEQFKLFRSASALIGTHGTGLANAVWMDVRSNERPAKVVEFTPGGYQYSDDAYNFNRYRNYVQNYWGLPYDYHHIAFAPNSTDDRTFIDLEVLDVVLDGLFKQVVS